MDNEATRIIIEENSPKEQIDSQQQVLQTKSNGKRISILSAASAFAGAAIGVATSAAASTIKNENDATDIIDDKEVEENAETPSPDQVILANDEGIRYAHVDAVSFNDAFAQARQQVGPGGVFEYNGRLYGTYYAEEWANMSSMEKAEYQRRVYEMPSSQHDALQDSNAESVVAHSSDQSIPANSEMISAEPVDNDIKVLGIEAVHNDYGQVMNIALVESEGDHALLIDVDNNGSIDVLIHDDNEDGLIDESEIHDISRAGIDVAELIHIQAVQQGDVLYTANDDMPDYINDADSVMTI